jgi:Mrp family chromosome partitioning ATPase/capsular polysaccharide biosynthesis protein
LTGTDRDGLDVLNLRDYVEVISRRRWVILTTAVVLAILASVGASLQTSQYRSSLDVLLSRQTPLQELTADGGVLVASPDPARFVMTQAELARSPEVAERVVRAVRVGPDSAARLLGSSEVRPIADADVLRFEVTDPHPRVAERLAEEYAEQFRIYRRALDRAQIRRALTSISAAIRELDALDSDSPSRAALVEQAGQLRTLEAGVGANVRIVSGAGAASPLGPDPVAIGTLAFFIGLVVGLMVAFLREALDSRVRSPSEAASHLGLPVVASIPALHRRRRAAQTLTMLAEPSGSVAEAFWALRTRLEVVTSEQRVIMVTSAVTGEGKSTTAGNLAIAIARSGRRVILAEFDVRRPSLAERFGIDASAGLTDVVSGAVKMDDTLQPIAISAGVEESRDPVEPRAPGGRVGTLQLLTAGSAPLDPGRLLSRDSLAEVIREDLAERADLVLIDTPGMLEYGDALAISASVDSALVLARLGVSRRAALAELRASLDSTPVPALGLVVIGGLTKYRAPAGARAPERPAATAAAQT